MKTRIKESQKKHLQRFAEIVRLKCGESSKVEPSPASFSKESWADMRKI